jgi:magnesium transporter
VDDADRPLCVEDLPHDMVSRFMSSGVQTIAAEAGLLEAARIMCATHVHRLPVMDEQHRPCGVVTSLDIVAALVNTVEEQQGTQKPKPGVHSTGR